MSETDIVDRIGKLKQLNAKSKARRRAEAVQNQPVSEEKPVTMNEAGVKSPIVAAARSAATILGGDRAVGDVAGQMHLAKLISDRAVAAHQDFTGEVHQMLIAQVVVLEAMITKHSQLLGLAANDEMMQVCADIVLKAQGELRKTLLALHEIRNPKKPTQFIKQYVNQQLNQLRADLIQPQLETDQHEPIAIPATERPQAVKADSPMEAMGAIDRG